jgi:two-component system, NtrC family, nitrogen regulation sensor histidine kinase NtrY
LGVRGPLPPDERLRRRRETVAIGVTAVLFALLAVIGLWTPELSLSDSQASNVLFFLVTNLNLVLLILLMFLVVRNLVKLLLERRRGIVGSRLRSRLVLAFVGLSLIPTIMLFLVAEGFISRTIDNWFSGSVEQSLSSAFELGNGLRKKLGNDGLRDARVLAEAISTGGLLADDRRAELRALIERERGLRDAVGIDVHVGEQLIASVRRDDARGWRLALRNNDLGGALTSGESFLRPLALREGEVIRCGVPIRDGRGAASGVVIVDVLIPRSISRNVDVVARSYQEYRQMKTYRQPMKNSYTLSFLLITLVVVFSATWFGFYLAKGITGPIQRLGEGMREVAHGNWDYRAQPEGDEEIAELFGSFNQMTADLTANHSALEERRRYIENILANIAAGVISIDAEGCVATINPAAEMMLTLPAESVRGRLWRHVFDRPELRSFSEIIERVAGGESATAERQLNLTRGSRELAVWVTVTSLTVDDGSAAGMILFVEDVTHLLRVERMEAWREVARRIAHEIKNPLTPIQLSAQRLRKGYGDGTQERDRTLLDECTRTIIGQVDALKRLVNEFSTFARLPTATFAPEDLNRIVEDALILFRDAHAGIAFVAQLDGAIPPLALDRDAVKRAVVNLLDNAVSACQSFETADARIEVVTAYDEGVGVVRLEVADNGSGMSPDVKARAFEPYFSTKRDGTGLGLAIVSAIAADHQAYARIRDNHPRGTRVIIEFPMRRAAVLPAAANA